MAACKKTTVRAISTVAAGGAVLTLAWSSVALDKQSTPLAIHTPPPPTPPNTGAMSLGATTTKEEPVTNAATQRAQPSITGTAALPSEEAGLP